MALTKAETEYRHRVIVPRYLAGVKAELLAKELGISESALRGWFCRMKIQRFGPKKQGWHAELSPWARRAFSPCAEAIRATDPDNLMSNEVLAKRLGYTPTTIRKVREAMEFVKRQGASQ